jgi:hypothetical protein
MSVCFFSLLCMNLGGFNFVPIYCKRLPVFFKQRNYNFFPAWTYAVMGSFMRLPEQFAQAAVWSIMVYFSVGFYRDAGRFFIFFLNLFSCCIFSNSLFSACGAVMRNDVLAQVGAGYALWRDRWGWGYLPAPARI